MKYQINRAVVIGSGTMGAALAANRVQRASSPMKMQHWFPLAILRMISM
jgi:3-hydroxyacyl-CoA dehydrogenase